MRKIICKVFMLSFLTFSVAFLMGSISSKGVSAYDYIDEDGYKVTITDFDVKPSNNEEDEDDSFYSIIEQPIINEDVPKEQIKNGEELETILPKSEVQYVEEYNFYMENKPEGSSMELSDYIEARKSGLSFSQAISKCEVIDYGEFYDGIFNKFQENEEDFKKNVGGALEYLISDAGQEFLKKVGSFFQDIFEDMGIF